MSAFVDAPVETPATHILFSEIISALTFALDATEGALPGHSLRSCLLGMRLGVAMGLPRQDLALLYYALQLKDAGCSSNAARVSAIMGGGNDRALKNASKLADWTRPSRPNLRYLREVWKHSRPGVGSLARLRHLLHLAASPENHTKEFINLRCERGAAIVQCLGIGNAIAEAVHSLDEHWDGSGYPEGKRGKVIPILSRICSVAQHLDAYAVADGPQRAVQALKTRRFWYDPALIGHARALHHAGRLWQHCLPTDSVEDTRQAVLALDPGTVTELSEASIDRICAAFASIVDAKSPFTYRHSLNVTAVASAIATELNLSPTRAKTIRRAALLHDVGKLSVPNSILDKNGKLTEDEWTVVHRHPGISGDFLRRIPTFNHVAQLAEQHHERLDGTGYPFGLRDAQLSLESRIIALADCYTAMAEDRPYRSGMPRDRIFALLAKEIPRKLDPVCFTALEHIANTWPTSFPPHADLIEEPKHTTPDLSWNWSSCIAAPV